MMASYRRLNLKPHRNNNDLVRILNERKWLNEWFWKRVSTNYWWSTQLFKQLNVPEAPNENIVQNHLNIALLNVF